MRDIKKLERLLAETNRKLLESQQQIWELEHRFLNDLAGLSLHLLAQQQQSNEPNHCNKCIALVDAQIRLCKLHYQGFRPGEALRNEPIGVAPYLLAVARELQRSLVGVLDIRTSIDPGVLLDRERVVLIGQILHEAVTNARKYAFPNGERGSVRIDFHKTENRLELIVADDGVGFDLAKMTPGTGTSIMHHLARQLRGTIQYAQLLKGTELRLNLCARPMQARRVRAPINAKISPALVVRGHAGSATRPSIATKLVNA